MVSGPSWEEETRAMVHEVLQEKRKAEHRLSVAQHAIEECDRKLAGLQTAFDVHRDRYGMPRVDLMAEAAGSADEFHNKSLKEMLILWVAKHAGEVVMRDATRTLTAAGLFTDERQASGGLYSTIKRMPEFESVRRGVYRLRVPRQTPQSGSVALTASAMAAVGASKFNVSPSPLPPPLTVVQRTSESDARHEQ